MKCVFIAYAKYKASGVLQLPRLVLYLEFLGFYSMYNTGSLRYSPSGKQYNVCPRYSTYNTRPLRYSPSGW